MDDYTYFHGVHQLLIDELRDCRDPARIVHLNELKAENRQRIQDAAFKPPVVFSFPMPGYVLIGTRGRERELPAPDLDGLYHAWDIFIEGIMTRDTLHASDLLRNAGKWPGNALRNTLAKASDWVEKQAGCLPLANAMRSPAMRISAEGVINYIPPRGLVLELH